MEPIVNRVAESDIEVFNLESIVEFDSIVLFDISPFLDRGIIVREKEFRQHVRDFDWSILQDKHVALNCSTDAIVPSWAYMLVAIRLNEVAATVYQGTGLDLIRHLFRMRLESGHRWLRIAAGPRGRLPCCRTIFDDGCEENHVWRTMLFGPALAQEIRFTRH